MDGKLRNMTSIYLSDNNNNLLLLYRIGSKAIKDSYIGTAGGHFENEELNNARACILRELNEETNLSVDDIVDLKLRYVTLRHKKDEIRQNYYFFAKLVNKNKVITSNEGNLKWFKFDEILKLDMPHTAEYMIRHYIDEGRFNEKLYGGIAVKDGVSFIELENFE
ncbi:MAG TPA: NUDIX domain-containing protein [Clostridiaceae bacterium]|nr:NUDIX domain-containing protein [Clostridiaceae bacterium]